MSVYVLGRRNSVSLWEPGVCGSLLISMLVSDDRHVFDQSVISEVCRQEEFRSNALCSHSPLNHLRAHNSNTKEYHFIYYSHITNIVITHTEMCVYAD